MSNLLMDDRPMQFLPALAKLLGSCERAIVLQQIFWLSKLPRSGIEHDGYKWVWGTYEEWCEDFFTMWSPHTLAKHIRNLEADGYLISEQLRSNTGDRTKFYRVNLDKLNEREEHATNTEDHATTSGTTHATTSGTTHATTSGSTNLPHPVDSTIYTEMSSEMSTERGAPAPARAPARATPKPNVLRVTSPHFSKEDFNEQGFVPSGLGTNAVQVYYERADIRSRDARLSAMKEDDLIRLCPDLDRLREVMVAYTQTGYRQGNLRLILDWYREGVPEHQRPKQAANGNRRMSKIDNNMLAIDQAFAYLEKHGVNPL